MIGLVKLAKAHGAELRLASSQRQESNTSKLNPSTVTQIMPVLRASSNTSHMGVR